MKVAKWLFFLLVIAGLGYVGYLYFLKKTPATRSWGLVPANTVFVVETHEPIQAWNTLRQTNFWKHLRTHPEFAEINNSCLFLDSLIQQNKSTLSFLGSRQLLISAHLTRLKDYDFLYIVDLQEISKIDFLGKLIRTIAGQQGFKVTERSFQGNELIELYDPKSRDILTLCLYQNYLLASYTPSLVEASLEAAQNPTLATDPNLLKTQQLTETGLANLYIQFNRFDDYLRIYFQDDDHFTKDLATMLSFAGIQINLDDQEAWLEGAILLNDTNQTYLHALQGVSPAEPLIHNILPTNTALYCSIGFEDWDSFWQALKKQYNEGNAKTSNWQKNLDKIQKWLNYDLEKHFLSWIGQEIALAVIPKSNSTKPGYLMVLHTAEPDKAKIGLDLMVRQVKRKTPLKFDLLDYNGHDIRYLEIKGLFKLLFGKLFASFDRPFFATIGNFVLFSNDLETLKATLDSYNSEKILAKQTEYSAFWKNTPAKSTIRAYWYMPSLYRIIPNYVSKENLSGIEKNAPYIQAFRNGGIHWASQEDHYSMKFGFHYQTEDTILKNPQAATSEPDSSTQEEISNDLNNNDLDNEKQNGKYVEDYPDKTHKIIANYKDGRLHGKYTFYHPNGKKAETGYYQNGQKVGTWRYYSESGKLTEKKRYSDDIFDDDERN